MCSDPEGDLQKELMSQIGTTRLPVTSEKNYPLKVFHKFFLDQVIEVNEMDSSITMKLWEERVSILQSVSTLNWRFCKINIYN